MRKLSWSLIAILLAFFSIHLLSTFDPTALYALRDGILLALAATFLFAWQVGPFAHHGFVDSGQWVASERKGLPFQSDTSTLATTTTGPTTYKALTATGGILLGTGIGCIVGAALLSFFSATVVAGQTAMILRWVGWALLLFGIAWPRVWQSRWPGGSSAQMTTEKRPSSSGQGSPWLGLLVLMLLGLITRLWVLSRLPGACVGAECDFALALNGTLPAAIPAEPLLQVLLRFTTDTLRAVRFGAILIGLAVPLFFYLALRRLIGSGAALLGAMLLVFSPWFVGLGGGAMPLLLMLFWSTAALWLLCEGLHRGDPRWFLVAGLAFGMVQGDLLIQGALLFWLLLFILLYSALLPLQSHRQPVAARLTQGLLLVGGYLCVLLPRLIQTQTIQSGSIFALLTTAAANAFDQASYFYALFQQGIAIDSYWSHVPPFVMPMSLLVLLGLGFYLRLLNRLPYLWLAGGLLLFGTLFYYTGSPAGLGLFFLLAHYSAAFALAALVTFVTTSWRPLVADSRMLALGTLFLLFFLVRPLLANLNTGQGSASQEMLAIEQRMLDEIATLHAADPARAIFVPASLMQNPSARLRLGDETLATLQPLADLLNALYTTDEIRTTTYFVPVTEQPYLALIQRMQPGATVSQQVDPATGEWLFSEVTVDDVAQLAQQGLLGVAWAGNEGSAGAPLMLPTLGPLQYSGDDPNAAASYSLQWSGSLRIAIPGTYRFAIDPTLGNGQWQQITPTTPLLTLQLDNRLVLDTSLGLLSQEIDLVKGFYQIALNYQPATAVETENTATVPFAIRWSRPDGIDEIIPRTVLKNLPLPNFGLIGQYYWGEGATGEPFDIRKDLLLGNVPLRNELYTVRWQGQLAAPRSGEYLLATLSGPGSATRLTVDGMMILDSAQIEDSEETADPALPTTIGETLYAEGSIYLSQGWHAVEIVHKPDERATDLQLLWQAPGSSPTVLETTYFVPILIPLAEVDRNLPSPPPLVREGDPYGFALSYNTEFWQPQSRIPPGLLPQLTMTTEWQLNRCGSGDAELDQPHGVAISGVRGLVYVVDTANQRVVEYTMDGTVNQIYRSPSWQEPFAIAIIDDSFPVVLDATTQLLYDLNPATGLVTSRPQRATFYRPRGLAVDSRGNLLVADTGGGRVVQVAPGGDELQSFGGQGTQLAQGQPTGVAGAGGALWAVTPEDGRLWHLESGGSFTAIEKTNTLNGPHLTALPTGELFLSDPVRRMVLYLAATGEPLAQMVVGSMSAPTGLAATTRDNRLYLAVADSDNCGLGLWQMPLSELPSTLPPFSQ